MELRDLRQQFDYRYVIEMDGSSNRKSFKRIDEATRISISSDAVDCFGLDDDIAKAWEIMVIDYEEMTGKSLCEQDY